jgi:hypothetical protein
LWTERKLNGQIRILGLADQRITILPIRNWKWQFLSQISWAADGKSLYALAQSASSMATLVLDSNGKPRVLHEMPSGTGWVSSIVPSPDGRLLAFTRRMFVHDVMLLENPYSYLEATLCARSVPVLRGKGGSVWLTKLPGLSIFVGIANIAPYRLLSRTWHLCVGDAMNDQISRRQPHVLKKRSVTWTGTHTLHETRVGVPSPSKQRWN